MGANSPLNRRPEWKILTEHEQAALSLSLGHSKSSWQAGEILGKSHYKYLELKSRASYFLKRFNEHFQSYPTLLPPNLNLHPSVEAYFEKTIGKRLKVNKALEEIEDIQFGVTSYRNKLITEEIQRLSKSSRLEARDFINLVKDFDRWNNFRILPPALQEPTAYKRRNKHKIRKLVKQLYYLTPIAFEFLKKNFTSESNKRGKEGPYLVPLFNPTDKKPYTLITSKAHLSRLTEMGLFVFTHPHSVERFHLLIQEYMVNEKKHCRDGQRFWPNFRRLIQDAHNFGPLHNLPSTRRLLDYVTDDWDARRADE